MAHHYPLKRTLHQILYPESVAKSGGALEQETTSEQPAPAAPEAPLNPAEEHYIGLHNRSAAYEKSAAMVIDFFERNEPEPAILYPDRHQFQYIWQSKKDDLLVTAWVSENAGQKFLSRLEINALGPQMRNEALDMLVRHMKTHKIDHELTHQEQKTYYMKEYPAIPMDKELLILPRASYGAALHEMSESLAKSIEQVLAQEKVQRPFVAGLQCDAPSQLVR
jgi:hypothetical protein